MEFSLAVLLFTPHQFWDLTLGLEIPINVPPPLEGIKTNKPTRRINYLMQVLASMLLPQAWRDFAEYGSSPNRTLSICPEDSFLCGPFLHPTQLSPTPSTRQSSRLASGRALVAKSSWKPMCSGEAEPLGVRPSQMVSMEGCAGGSNQALQPAYTQGWGWVFIYLVLLYRPVMSGSSLKILCLLCQ